MNVLVVDDEPIIRIGLRSLVDWGRYGFTLVGEAEDGEEAWQRLRELEVDIVITDLLMPRMDGLELIRRIKESKEDVAVVVLSCMDDFSYVKEAMKHGAKDYVLKPTMEPEQLIPLLQGVKEELEQEREARRQLSAWQERLEQTRQLQLSGKLADYIKHGIADPLLESELFGAGKPMFLTLVYAAPETLRKEAARIRNGCDAELDWGVDRMLLLSVGQACRVDPEGKPCFVGTFGPLHDWASLNNALEQMERQIHAWFYSIREESGISQQGEGALPYETRADLLRAMEHDNKDAFFHHANALVQKLSASKPPIEKVRGFVYELLVMAVGFAREKAVSGLDDFERTHVSKEAVDGFVTLESLKGWLVQTLEQLLQLRFGSGSETGAELALSNPFIRKALQFIKENYAKNIGTLDIAEHVRLSRSYLSDLYSKEMGESLIETLTRIRIMEAKRRLRSGELKVYEVAEAVGFADAKTFAKTFKRIVGCTPKEYEAQNK
jgi:two-component system response regulator YesN